VVARPAGRLGRAGRPGGRGRPGRAALLAAVSQDLRAPLAAAKAAVSGLRAGETRLTADDRADLLAAAEESLDRLAHLAASLLDVSRLQAGARAVLPLPTELGKIVAAALEALGPQPQPVLADIPSGLPEVMADPAITEWVIVNLAGNALRYSPAAAPPLLTARTAGNRVELCVVDHGPGIPAADRKRVFQPFCRLGALGDSTGVGLGLAVARGLAETMGGAVEPEDTPAAGSPWSSRCPPRPPGTPPRPAAPAGYGLRDEAGVSRRESEPIDGCDAAAAYRARPLLSPWPGQATGNSCRAVGWSEQAEGGPAQRARCGRARPAWRTRDAGGVVLGFPDKPPVMAGMFMSEADPAAIDLAVADMPAEVQSVIRDLAAKAYAEELCGTPDPPRVRS
jgi:hypothetical protein